MALLIIIILGFVPGFFWLWFFYRKDKIEPEPKALVIKVYLWGAFSVLPVLGVGLFHRNLGLSSSVIFTPIVEEMAKFLVVFFTVFLHREFDEPMDGIIYAAASALGFASVENAMYLIGNHPSPASLWSFKAAVEIPDEVLSVFYIRALLSVPSHVLDSSIWGFALGTAKFSRPNLRLGIIALGLTGAMIMHGLFNLAVKIDWGMLSEEPEFIFYTLCLIVGIGWFIFARMTARALERSPHRKHHQAPSGENT